MGSLVIGAGDGRHYWGGLLGCWQQVTSKSLHFNTESTTSKRNSRCHTQHRIVSFVDFHGVQRVVVLTARLQSDVY